MAPRAYRLPVYATRLVREASIPYEQRATAGDARSVADVIRGLTADRIGEAMIALAMDNCNRVAMANVVATGGLASVALRPSDVLRFAVCSAAPAIILGHNHPSGDPTPSREDRTFTARMREACEAIGIPLLDHVIVGEGARFFSFYQEGWPE